MLTVEWDIARPNYFEVDLDAIAYNTAEVRRLAGDRTRIFAAVKANGYGFGLAEVARTVLASGADALAMVDVVDGIKLRQLGITAPLLIYPGTLVNSSLVDAMCHHELMPSLVDLDTAGIYSFLASRRIKAFVKVDVGLERNGVPADHAVDVVKAMHDLPNLDIEGIYTHLHVPAQTESESYVEWQYERFLRVLEGLTSARISIPIQMAASSSPLRMTPKMMLNAIDPGNLLYGLAATGPEKVRLQLRPAFRSLNTRLIQVKQFRRTEFTEQAPFPVGNVTRIGIIPLGRADGMAAVNCGLVLVHGQRVRVLGTPSVEHTRIDLTAVPDAKVCDEVVIIGRQGKGEITLQEVMVHQGIDREHAVALEIRDSVRRLYQRSLSEIHSS